MSRLVLLTGATGYLGGRLLGELAKSGRSVRCLSRHPEHLQSRLGDRAEAARGDLLEPESLDQAMAGVTTAYYLVHSMSSRGNFAAMDRQAAENFARASRKSGVRRIIYLGGLADENQPLSPHMRSRHEVGRILRQSGVQVLEFRASIILGSGSLSFELIRSLVERLPVMTTPRWVSVPAQPIAVSDVLRFLVAALGWADGESRVFEIGGADVVSYRGIMREYARQRGLRRLMIPVPVLTPNLSSLWLRLVTPLYARVGRILIESIRHPSVVRDPSANQIFAIQPVGVSEAIRSATRNEDRRFAQTHWSDALSEEEVRQSWGGVRFGNRIVDSRSRHANASPERAFQVIERIGGANGWYYGNWLWRLRGRIDLLLGGVGMQRGRRDPERLSAGDVLDCWRVETVERPERLRLRAEMKLPGRAWLEFEVTPDGTGCNVRQTAEFDPLGLGGWAYWYLLYPAHRFIFRGMVRGIVERAERVAQEVILPERQ